MQEHENKPVAPATESVAEWLKREFGRMKQFQQHVWVRPDVGIVEISLEDVPCYHEWIKGEGADMAIIRALDDNRVVGAVLPLRKWNGSLPVVVDACQKIASENSL